MPHHLLLLAFACVALHAQAEDAHLVLPTIEVSGRADDLSGVADSASEGTVGASELVRRPTLRPAEVVETVPGMIITQHAGGGKANQYYLRGFNLDHGTDFAFFVDGVPVNLPTHAHGQGYADLNWVIPELIEGIDYRKGVYYADQGDFGNVGTARIRYFDVLPDRFVKLEAGSYGFARVLTAGSAAGGQGRWLYALAAEHYDGPWAVPDALKKGSGVLKYGWGTKRSGYSLGLQAYQGEWRGVDQVPRRAIDRGLIGRYGQLDPSTGGSTHRYALHGSWHERTDSASTEVVAYAVHYGLDLFSNFTYYVDQTHGDEFEQTDRDRIDTGARISHSERGRLFGSETETTFGFDLRQDWATVSLDRDELRRRVQHISTSRISQLNLAPWGENKTLWLEKFRTVAGARTDLFQWDVRSDHPDNSGSKFDGTVSPKLSLIFGPWTDTEFYLQAGLGFRTNDARGIFTKTAPDTGAPSRRLPAIVRSRGAEAGVRTSAVPDLRSTLSYWALANDSDTFFSADQGSLVDSDRPSLRTGIEWTNFYTPLHWLTIEADYAYSWAHFTDQDADGVGRSIPGAVRAVFSTAVSVRNIPRLGGLFASLRYRYFGPRPLIENDSERSASVGVVNLAAGYEINKNWTVSAEIFNLLDARYNDAEYYDSSRLKGEAAGPESDGSYLGHMVHAGDPFSVRLAVVTRF